jgi:integrase
MLSHNALLRSGEVSNRLQARDLEWSANMRSFRLRLLRTKTGRTGGGVFIDVAYCRHPLSGFQLVRRLWWARDLDNNPSSFLFPAIRRGFLVHAQPASSSSLRLLVKAVVITAGLDPRFYSGHSLRAGGATDLFASRVPYYTIKKMGRWRSETALIYFRSVDDVARTVSRAFDKIGARCQR